VGSAMLADGRMLVGYRFGSQTQIYNPSTNAFTAAANPCRMAAKQASKPSPTERCSTRPSRPAIPAVFESVDRDSYGTDHRIDPR